MKYTHLYIWLFVIFFAQSSFPYNLQLLGIVPNFVLSFGLATVLLFPFSIVWPLILIGALLLTIVSGVNFVYILLSFMLSAFLINYLKPKYDHNYLLYFAIFAVLFFYQITNLLIVIAVMHYSYAQVLDYLFRIGFNELIINYLITLIFYWFIGYLLKKPTHSIQLE
jgi:hypothetical protein